MLETSLEDLAPSPSQVVDGSAERVLAAGLRGIPVDAQVLLELHYWGSIAGATAAPTAGATAAPTAGPMREP